MKNCALGIEGKRINSSFFIFFNDSYRKSSYCHSLERIRNRQVCLAFHPSRDRARSHQTASATEIDKIRHLAQDVVSDCLNSPF